MSDLTSLQFDERIRRCVAQLRRDELIALGALYDLTSQRLLRFAMLVTRNATDAEDAIQAALLKLLRRPEALTKADSPWAYLLRVVRNESITLLRRRRPAAPLADASQATVWDEALLEQEDAQDRIRRALSRLPREQAEVIVLKIWEEMTFLQIAEVLGESPNTVASRYRYGLQKLEAALAPMSSEVRQL